MFKQSQILQKKNQKPHFSIYDLTYQVFISLGNACIVVLVCFFQKIKIKFNLKKLKYKCLHFSMLHVVRHVHEKHK
jgi:hypothetical protein